MAWISGGSVRGGVGRGLRLPVFLEQHCSVGSRHSNPDERGETKPQAIQRIAPQRVSGKKIDAVEFAARVRIDAFLVRRHRDKTTRLEMGAPQPPAIFAMKRDQ